MNKWRLTFIILFFLQFNGFSQTGVKEALSGLQVMTDAYGRPMYMRQSYRMDGSPFFALEYNPATIITAAGKVFTQVLTIFNFTDNTIVCKMDTAEFVVTIPVARIYFQPSAQLEKETVFMQGFPKIDAQTDKSFYEVLDSGKATLLRWHQIEFRDEVPYGNATVIRHYEERSIWYAFAEGRMNRINLNNDFIIQLLPDSKNRVAKFIADNNLKCRREEDLKKVFSFYNALF
jgi:hypothetical protein